MTTPPGAPWWVSTPLRNLSSAGVGGLFGLGVWLLLHGLLGRDPPSSPAAIALFALCGLLGSMVHRAILRWLLRKARLE